MAIFSGMLFDWFFIFAPEYQIVWLVEFQTFEDKSSTINENTGVDERLVEMIMKLHCPRQKMAVGKLEYKKIIEDKKINAYNEQETKKDFIEPLFRALGWHTDDSSEVTAEENISKKRVDYGFKLNGIPKFYLEAKSLKEDLLNTKEVSY